MSLRKIVSGGQTGVDRAALDAALELDVAVGGWCPKGRRAEDGPIPKRYPLRETPLEEYAQRTIWNVRDSDGTLIVGDPKVSGGTSLTKEEARRWDKPLLQIKTGESNLQEVRAWIVENNIEVLNVAGPRASEVQGIYEAVKPIMMHLLQTDSSSRTSDEEGRRR